GKSGKNVCRKFNCENRGSQRGGGGPLEGPASILRCATSLGWRRPKSRAFCVFSSPKTRRWLFEGTSPPPIFVVQARRRRAHPKSLVLKNVSSKYSRQGTSRPAMILRAARPGAFYIPEPFRR